MGARSLIVHYGDYLPGLRERMQHRVKRAKVLRQVADFGQDVVYEIQER